VKDEELIAQIWEGDKLKKKRKQSEDPVSWI
jgi:hypothetical protein